MDIRDSQRIKQIRDNTEKMADAFTRIADALEQLTEPQKQGEWIDIWEDARSSKSMCNNCKIESDRPLGNFCKWCGARMKGADDE